MTAPKTCRHCGVSVILRKLDSTGPVWMHERVLNFGASLGVQIDVYRVCRCTTVADPVE